EGVPLRAVLPLDLAEELAEPGVRLRVAELAADVVEALVEVGPDGIVDPGRRELPDRRRLLLAEGVVREVAPRDADDGEVARQGAVAPEVVGGGDQLALRQVSGGAEDDDRAGVAGSRVGHRLSSPWDARRARRTSAASPRGPSPRRCAPGATGSACRATPSGR